MGDFSKMRRVRVCYIANDDRIACKDYVFGNMDDAIKFSDTHICNSLEIYDIDDVLLYTKPIIIHIEEVAKIIPKLTKYAKLMNWVKSL